LSESKIDLDEKVIALFSEASLKSCLQYGIGFIHDGLTEKECRLVKQLYKKGSIRVLLVMQKFCWEVTDLESHIVVLMDVERYDGTERRLVEYSIPDVLQMQGLASRSKQQDG